MTLNIVTFTKNFSQVLLSYTQHPLISSLSLIYLKSEKIYFSLHLLPCYSIRNLCRFKAGECKKIKYFYWYEVKHKGATGREARQRCFGCFFVLFLCQLSVTYLWFRGLTTANWRGNFRRKDNKREVRNQESSRRIGWSQMQAEWEEEWKCFAL